MKGSAAYRSLEQAAYRRFWWWIAGGVLIAVLLLSTAILNFRFVSGFVATQETRQELNQEVVALEQRIRQLAESDPALLKALVAHAKTDRMLWIEFRDERDQRIARSGLDIAPALTPARQRELLRLRRPAFRVRDTMAGRALEESFGVLMPGLPVRYGVLDIGMRIDQPSPGAIWLPFRNLLIESAAALALLAALITMAVRFRAYAKGQHLEQQVAIARQVQQDLMPASAVRAEGFDISAQCDPATEVGGDFYDVFPVQVASGRLGTAFVVGDVSGKGLPASLLMGVLHGAVRSSLWTDSYEHHQDSTRQMNRLLYEHAAQERYASMFWGYYDPDGHVLRYINAGHPPPLLIRDGAAKRLDCGGPVLGVLPDARYEQGSVSFAEGDILLLYSDGIVEAARPQDAAADAHGHPEEFGIERLADLAVEAGEVNSAELHHRIITAVQEFTGGAVADDRTLLVIRRQPARVAKALETEAVTTSQSA